MECICWATIALMFELWILEILYFVSDPGAV